MGSKKFKLSLAVLFFCTALAILFVQIKKSIDSTTSGKGSERRVVASTFALASFASIIGSDKIAVQTLFGENENPNSTMPGFDSLSLLQTSNLILLNGASFEQWLPQVSLPQSKLLITSSKLKGMLIEHDQGVTHSHDSGPQHTHKTIDPWTWLDPKLALKQSHAILTALQNKYPEFKNDFKNNYLTLEKELNKLDQTYASLTLPPLAAAKPYYNYLARRYGWNITSFNFSHEKSPGLKNLAQFQHIIQKKNIKFLIWPRRPDKKISEIFEKQFNIKNLVFNPLASRPFVRNYFGASEHNIKQLKKCISLDFLVSINDKKYQLDELKNWVYGDVANEPWAENFISSHLFLKEAKKLNLSLNEDLIDRESRKRFKSEWELLKMHPDQYAASLEGVDGSVSKLKSFYLNRIRIEVTSDFYASKIYRHHHGVQEHELKELYEQTYGPQGKKYQCQHIYKAVPMPTNQESPHTDTSWVKKREEVRRHLEKLKNEVENGSDFEELASKKSDMYNQKYGASLSMRRVSTYPEGFKEKLYQLKKGELAILESENGLHLIKVFDLKETPLNDELKEELEHVISNKLISSQKIVDLGVELMKKYEVYYKMK